MCWEFHVIRKITTKHAYNFLNSFVCKDENPQVGSILDSGELS